MTPPARNTEPRRPLADQPARLSAYDTWPTQSRPNWSLEDARHRNAESIAPDPMHIPAWGSQPTSIDPYDEVIDLPQAIAYDRAAKVARARALTDPLGAKGFRQTRKRVKRETSARRRVFAVSVAAFATCFGMILHANSDSGGSTASAETAAIDDSASGNQISALIVLDPTNTPTPTATATPSSTAKTTTKAKSTTAKATKTATAEPTETATPKPTKTPEPTATATEVVVQAPAKHTKTKSS